MNNELVFSLIVVSLVGSSIASFGQTAYGNDINFGGEPQDASEQGFVGTIGSVIGGSVTAIAGFFESLLPATTGIWIVDDIINALGLYAGFLAIQLLRGIW